MQWRNIQSGMRTRKRKESSKIEANFECFQCQVTFTSVKQLKEHKCKKIKTEVPKAYNCRICNTHFINRHDLHIHVNQIHGGNDLQSQPWQEEEAPWRIHEGLKDVYRGNQRLILAPKRRVTKNKTVYNVVTNDLENGHKEFKDAIEEIYEQQENSFKINLMLGVILRHIVTGEFRYFTPYSNDYLLPQTQLIASRIDVDSFLKKLKDIDPANYVRNKRPNSSWKPFMITNIQIDVFSTNFTMGGRVQLPNYVKNSKKLKLLIQDRHQHPYQDNLCFFRALTLLKTDIKDPSFENQVLDLYHQWTDEPVKKFKGIGLNVIPEIESRFSVKINIYEMQPDKSVTPMYLSVCKYEETLNLNHYNGHLSFITEFRWLCQEVPLFNLFTHI